MVSSSTQSNFDRYSQLLLPLFRLKEVDLFQLAAVLLRLGGGQNEGWDSLEESRQMLEDLIQLNQLKLPKARFKDPDTTHWRLHLLSYVHLTEMSSPYHVLANLLRVKANLKYTTRPFREAGSIKKARFSRRKSPHASKKFQTRSPLDKMREIKMLSVKAGLSELSEAFDEFYVSSLRNSIAHSDYVLFENEFRMTHKGIVDPKNSKKLTSVISFDDMSEIISRAYDFYTAFFTLQDIAKSEFAAFKGKCFMFDKRLKGLVEFLVNDEGFLNGFKIHWPNSTESIYRRDDKGCVSKGILEISDGTFDFFPGRRYPSHHEFSVLVPKGKEPTYTATVLGETPSWPE